MIHQSDIDSLVALTGMRGFTPLACLFGAANLGEEGTKELKEAIMNDLTAWNMLGGFTASIAFGGLLVGRVDEPLVPSILVGEKAWAWLSEALFATSMVFAGFCGLRSVVAATLKYLYINSIPHTAILPGIAEFRNGVYSQGKNMSTWHNWGAMLWDHSNSGMMSIKYLGIGFTILCSQVYGFWIGIITAFVFVNMW
eukprot:CAMPEP_0172617238 /NCGR_PEP_ID=MMETSP1068-20121228/70130_1 /TAXON_ID=35684 /ORGANISM="Pseudopedinella elastica, Strain CCMP716" /LENGTH=196 /DNA_ID=CAMNT_0013422957 /DNA_START=216 /DNA_END=803 /DNA_ORIENTATION=+